MRSWRLELQDNLGELRLTQVITDTLHVHVDRRAVLWKRVGLDSAAIPLALDYSLTSSIVLSADSVLLQGPAAALDTLPDTLWLSIGEGQLDYGYEGEELVLPGLPDFVVAEPDEVAVSFSVSPTLPYAVKVPLEVRNAPDSLWRPRNPVVDVAGIVPARLVGQVADSLFTVILDYDNRDPEDSTAVPVLLDVPDFVLKANVNSTPVQLVRVVGEASQL